MGDQGMELKFLKKNRLKCLFLDGDQLIDRIRCLSFPICLELEKSRTSPSPIVRQGITALLWIGASLSHSLCRQ